MLSKSYAKYIQSLHHKKFRDETGLFFAEGPKLVGDLLADKKFHCRSLLATADWQAHAVGWGGVAADEWIAVSAAELDKISALTTPNQVLAVFEQAAADGDFSPRGGLTLLLDGVQDPGNMGSILRTADWFGVCNVVCTPTCADAYAPKVVQGSMGSIARLNMVYTDALNWLAGHDGLPVYGAVLDGADVTTIGKIPEGILVAGSEGRGISAALLEQVSHKVTIPGKGGAESLNVAVAVGVILSHLC